MLKREGKWIVERRGYHVFTVALDPKRDTHAHCLVKSSMLRPLVVEQPENFYRSNRVFVDFASRFVTVSPYRYSRAITRQNGTVEIANKTREIVP